MTTAQEPPFRTERRRYPRQLLVWPTRICQVTHETARRFHAAKIKNLGQGGTKITALPPFARHTQTCLELDLKRLAELIKTGGLLLVSDNQLLAEVIWRRLNLETGLFETGLRFISAAEKSRYRQALEKTASA